MYEVQSKEYAIHVGEKAIFGRIWLPAAQGKRPAIILSHGYNGCHADFETECAFFAAHGVIAYSLDFCGGSTRSRSSGKSTDMTLFTEKQDLLDVFDHISALEEVDPARVYLLGGSQGGIVTGLAAEERADRVRGVALYFPAFGIPDNWNSRFAAEEDIPETLEFWGLTLGKVFFTSMRGFSAFEHIGGYQGPVVILQGDQDGIVSVASSRRAAQKYPHAELVILPGEGHGFTAEGIRTAMDRTLEMIRATGAEKADTEE